MTAATRPPESRAAGVKELRECYAVLNELPGRWSAAVAPGRWSPPGYIAEEINIDVDCAGERAAFLEKWLSCDDVEEASR